MTDEQIKQNAEDIVNTLTIRPEACIYSRSNMISAAIAGAHSRDEDIKLLKIIIDEQSYLIDTLTESKKKLIKERKELKKIIK